MNQDNIKLDNNLSSNSGQNSVNTDGILAGEIREISGKILGIDYGSKNIGLAISDAGQSQAFVYDTLQMSEEFWLELNDIIEEEKIDKIIVGLPLNMNGDYTKKTEEVVCFIEVLESYVKIPVETEDERLSTVEGAKLGGVGDRDEEAARIILQRYLDAQINTNGNMD